MNDQRAIWSSLVCEAYSDHRLRKVMWSVSRGLSEVTGRVISNDDPLVEMVPLGLVPERAGGSGTDVVGVYLVIGGGLRGQAILILPVVSALNLVDMMMDEELGTTTELGILERSALSEAGNMTLSCFLNAVASLDEVPDMLRPSPPTVMVDMLDAIMDVIVAPVAAVRNDLLVIETMFQDTRGAVQGRLWVLPDPALQDLC
jgi:chemotaxis protein CheC